MTSIVSFLRSSPGLLKLSGREHAPSMDDVVDRILEIARLDETELATLMGTAAGGSLARFAVPDDAVDPDSLLRDWDSIGRASPAELTASQYEQFLHGDAPVTEVDAPVMAAYDLDQDQQHR